MLECQLRASRRRSNVLGGVWLGRAFTSRADEVRQGGCPCSGPRERISGTGKARRAGLHLILPASRTHAQGCTCDSNQRKTTFAVNRYHGEGRRSLFKPRPLGGAHATGLCGHRHCLRLVQDLLLLAHDSIVVHHSWQICKYEMS